MKKNIYKYLLLLLSLVIVIVIVIVFALFNYLNKINNGQVIINDQKYFVAEYFGSKEKSDEKDYVLIFLALQRPWSFSHYYSLPKYPKGLSLIFEMKNGKLVDSYISDCENYLSIDCPFLRATSTLEVNSGYLNNVRVDSDNTQMKIKQINISKMGNADIEKMIK